MCISPVCLRVYVFVRACACSYSGHRELLAIPDDTRRFRLRRHRPGSGRADSGTLQGHNKSSKGNAHTTGGDLTAVPWSQ